MTESVTEELSWWDWARSTKDKVVNQSNEVLGYVKKDIDEFTKVIAEEASAVVSNTATVFKEKLQLDDNSSTASQLKSSVSGFFNHVADVFTPPPDDGDVEAIMICNQQPVFLDRLQAATYQVCSDHSNFLKDQEDESKQYESWLETFNIEDHQHELSEMLLQNNTLRQTYSSLVPAQVSHVIFWHRYYYQMFKLKEAESKREKLKLRAENVNEESHAFWDDEEDFGSNIEISEQLQKKLLEDYESEFKNEKGLLNETEAQALNTFITPTESIDNESGTESDSNISCRKEKASSSPASSKDTEESWDKLQSLEAELQASQTSTKESLSSKSEDWETWE